jgi:hypothetical protein
MAWTNVGPAHPVAGGILSTQIQRDTAQTDPQKAFQAVVSGALSATVPIANGVSKEYPWKTGTLRIEIDNFTLLPPGSTPANATHITALAVFKVIEIFTVTIGSVPISADLK